ncbi:uncharacterized protein LOC121386745 [Gigantopelta aegis]|uniref:uncharacterized protein LOC121386745 n=1 Tax=Gigantopelta aegis TaxID=1735272 RepID=UPI001B88C8B2|nr:uncharacterized protein LOC121386745 [Gigantopelta aegis]
MKFVFLILLISVLWSSVNTSEVGAIKLIPSSSPIKLGWRYNLHCAVAKKIQNRSIVFERNNVRICQILWYRSGNVYCNTTHDVLSGYECQCSGPRNDTLIYRVIIKSFSTVDFTQWICSSVDSDGASGPVYISNFVFLYFSGVTLTGNKKMFDADGLNSINLTCTTSNMTGRAEFTWINKTSGARIENNLNVSKHYDAYTQELKFIPHWYQDGNKILCKAFNADTNMTTTSNVKVMNLTYPPLAHPVIKQDNNSNAPHDSEIVTREGAMLHLSCEVTGGKPSVSNISIVCDGIKERAPQAHDGAVGRISLKVWRNIHNHTCQCSAIHITGRYNLTTTVTILVNHAPDVTVRYDFNSSEKSLKVICETEGRPETYGFTPFIHFWNKYRIRELPGQLVEFNKNVLTIYNVTYADSGRYQCGASNGIDGLNKVKVQTGFTSVEFGEKPIFDAESKQNQTVSAVLGNTVVLERKIFSNSNITLHMWINGRDQHLTGRVSTTEVTLHIYGITVKDDGYSITLKILKLNEADLGLYKLDVCNIYGCGHLYTTLKVVSQSGSTSDSVLVAVVSGVTVVLILVIIVVAVIVTVRKRRNSTRNSRQHTTVEYVNTVNDVNNVNNVYDVNTVNIQTDDPHVYQTLNN